MSGNCSNLIEKWEKEEKQRKIREKDEMAAKQAKDMVEAFKQENKERQEQEKAERLKKKIDKCDGNNSREISKLLDEVKNKYKYLDNEVPGYIQDSLENLLNRVEHIDKELMKKIIRFTNSNEGGISVDNPGRWLSKCDFDDELIYNSIMAGYYKNLVGLIDENKLEEQRNKALNDIKKYFYSGGFGANRELFGLDYEEFPWILLEVFGDKGDLDKDFLRFAANNMDIDDIDRKYFKGMTDEEFNNVLKASEDVKYPIPLFDGDMEKERFEDGVCNSALREAEADYKSGKIPKI